MIRKFKECDLTDVMQIWLDSNIKAHHFISPQYWTDHYGMVKELLLQAEVYVCEDHDTGEINGFIGLTDDYIAGIFVREAVRSGGIGKQLLDYAKDIKPTMGLSVYEKNTRAVRFYQREQFVIQSEHVDEGTGEKEFVMVWKKESFL